jgi:hypothetical protein
MQSQLQVTDIDTKACNLVQRRYKALHTSTPPGGPRQLRNPFNRIAKPAPTPIEPRALRTTNGEVQLTRLPVLDSKETTSTV